MMKRRWASQRLDGGQLFCSFWGVEGWVGVLVLVQRTQTSAIPYLKLFDMNTTVKWMVQKEFFLIKTRQANEKPQDELGTASRTMSRSAWEQRVYLRRQKKTKNSGTLHVTCFLKYSARVTRITVSCYIMNKVTETQAVLVGFCSENLLLWWRFH